jgi:hypothetical protein
MYETIYQVRPETSIQLIASNHSGGHLPLRRGAERAFSQANRGLSKDYEIKTKREENTFITSHFQAKHGRHAWLAKTEVSEQLYCEQN